MIKDKRFINLLAVDGQYNERENGVGSIFIL